MKILILGHGRKYAKHDIRCSPCDVNSWFYSDYVCVDNDPNLNPDILFDLRNEWIFAKDNEYDVIIDSSGCALSSSCRSYSYKLMHSVTRCLNENGTFYGRLKTYKKVCGNLVEHSN